SPSSRTGDSLVDPQRSCRGSRTGSPGESTATLRLCSPGDRRGAGDVHNGLPISAPLVAPPAPPPKQRSRSDASAAGKYPIATYSPPPTPVPDTQKPQPPQKCGNCGIAQTRASPRPQATAAR